MVIVCVAMILQTKLSRVWRVKDGPGPVYRVSLPAAWIPDHRKEGGTVAGLFHSTDGRKLDVGYTAKVSKELLDGFLEVMPSMRKANVEITSRKFVRGGWQGYVITFRSMKASGLSETIFPNKGAVAMVRGSEIRSCAIQVRRARALPGETEAIGLCERVGV